MRNIVFTPSAFEDYMYWQSQDKKTLKRVNMLIADILRNGNEGIGKPEALTGKYSGFWSRRIDEKNRLIYTIQADTVIIIACRTHYGDK